MKNQEQEELQIVLRRAKYVLILCVGMALVSVLLLIFKV